MALHTTPLRTLTINSDKNTAAHRVNPFLWIKGNPVDTLRWDLAPFFNEAAQSNNCSALFRLKSEDALSAYTIMYNGEELSSDSLLSLSPNNPGILELIVPQSEKDNSFELKLNEIHSVNLDRINGARPDNAKITLSADIKTHRSLLEIIFWTLIILLALFLIVWFGLLRNKIYPKFKRGIITIANPYFATIRLKGYRALVVGPKSTQQSWWNKLWCGAILYHTNPAWPTEAEFIPSGKTVRFRSQSGTLFCDPSPLLSRGESYKIIDSNDSSKKIEINYN